MMFIGKHTGFIYECRKADIGSVGLYDEALREDNVAAFVSLLELRGQSYMNKDLMLELLEDVCKFNSVMCATALIKGDTPLKDVDVNCRDSKGIYPIHYAGWSCWPDITNAFLKHGALSEILCEAEDPNFKQKLPITLALERLGRLVLQKCRRGYPSAIFLIKNLLLRREVEALKTIGLLASMTSFQEIEEELFRFARYGKLAEFAALLMAAPKKLNEPKLKIQNFLSSNKNDMLLDDHSKRLVSFMHELLESLESEADYIEAKIMDKTELATWAKESWEECMLTEIVKPGLEWLGESEWPRRWKKLEGRDLADPPTLVLNIPRNVTTHLAWTRNAVKLGRANCIRTAMRSNLHNVLYKNPWASSVSIWNGTF